MKVQVTPAFEGDWARLSKDERATFQEVVSRRFHPACERRRTHPSSPWSASLRVKDVEGAPGVWEMTWSFAGPDGSRHLRVDRDRGRNGDPVASHRGSRDLRRPLATARRRPRSGRRERPGTYERAWGLSTTSSWFSRSLAGRGTRPADLQRTGPRIPRGQPGCPSHGRSSGGPHPTRRSARTRRAGLLHDP